MEVQYDQKPFTRPRYGCIVSEARHEEQRNEIKSAMHPYRGTRMRGTSRHALPTPLPVRRGMPIAADRR
jgi:hypothetical protein